MRPCQCGYSFALLSINFLNQKQSDIFCHYRLCVQNCTYFVRWYVTAEAHRPVRAELCEKWSWSRQVLTGSKDILLVLSPIPVLSIAKKQVQWTEHCREVGRKLLIEINQSQKALRFFDVLWHRSMQNGRHIVHVRREAFLTDDGPKILNSGHEEVALLEFLGSRCWESTMLLEWTDAVDTVGTLQTTHI